MRNKKQINALDTLAKYAIFPEYNEVFQRYERELRQVVGDNIGSMTATTLVYDEYTQMFWFQLCYGDKLARDGQGESVFVEVRRNFKVDPNLPLLPQLEAMESAQLEVNATFNLLYRLYSTREQS